MKQFLILASIVVASVAAQGQAPTSQQPAAPAPRQDSGQAGNPEAGKKLFVSYGCYQCHGYEAQGSSATGPRLGPRPIAFAAFSRYVRQPTGQMPPYTTKVMSDTNLANIYAYVQARPAPAQNVPLLK